MEDFLQEVTSLSWWLGVVLVSLLINLAAAYLKSPLDRSASKTFKWWANLSAKRRAHHEHLVNKIRQDPDFRFSMHREEFRCRHRELQFIVIACMGLVIFTVTRGKPEYPGLITNSIAALTFFALVMGFWQRKCAMQIQHLFDVAFPPSGER